MNKYIAIVLLLTLTCLCQAETRDLPALNLVAPAVSDNQQFRDEVIQYLRQIAAHVALDAPAPAGAELDRRWSRAYQTMDWSVHITVYRRGAEIGRGDAHGPGLADTLKSAVEISLLGAAASIAGNDDMAQLRFKVSFDYFPARAYSFIEYQGRGLELLGNRVAVRRIDAEMIRQQVQDSQRYLLDVMHPQLHGFYKIYNAGDNRHETHLRTIYSSSSLYSLLKLYRLNQDPELEKHFRPIADFILAQQIKSGENAGGFYYSYDPDKQKHSCLIVVGTASKSIFTLLELDRFYKNDPQYLQAARQAGDWLLTMVKADGQVSPIASCTHGAWRYEQKQSMLYSGQVLSALSRLYATTRDRRYLESAGRIARNFVAEIGKQGLLLGDDYRPPNSISSSWALMSLIDYARVNNEPQYRRLIPKLAAMLMARQINNPDDAFNAGRYQDTISTSGNGWINEVMGNAYDYCVSEQLSDCRPYRQAMIASSRWLLQNAYNEANSYETKNPARAAGGFIRNFRLRYVRTDAVCHGVNSLINLLQITGPGGSLSLELPEQPLAEILHMLRAGHGFMAI